MADVPLEDLIACVDRELAFRAKAFPRWIDQKKLTQKAADAEMARMRAVRQALLRGEAAHAAYVALAQECTLSDAEITKPAAAALAELERRFPVSA